MSFSKTFCCWPICVFLIFYCLGKKKPTHRNFVCFDSDSWNRSAFCLSCDLFCIHNKKLLLSYPPMQEKQTFHTYSDLWIFCFFFFQETCAIFFVGEKKKASDERSIIISIWSNRLFSYCRCVMDLSSWWYTSLTTSRKNTSETTLQYMALVLKSQDKPFLS